MANYHGTDLVGEDFIPANPRAALLIVHGMAEHRGRYAAAIPRLTGQRIACFTFDLRGHGHSPGVRADIPEFQHYVDDLLTLRAGIESAHPQLPLFIWAHSLGSIITIRCVEQRGTHLAGVITSGCPIAAFPDVPAPVRGTVVALATPFRGLLVNPRLPAEALSHSAAVQDDYRNDPLNSQKVTVGLLIELESACRDALEHAGSIVVPWLALHGGADTIAPPQGSQQLVDALGSTDKTVEFFAGMRHEVHNEIEPTPSDFYFRMINWIGKHVA
jgi:acylglycerol lipase